MNRHLHRLSDTPALRRRHHRHTRPCDRPGPARRRPDRRLPGPPGRRTRQQHRHPQRPPGRGPLPVRLRRRGAAPRARRVDQPGNRAQRRWPPTYDRAGAPPLPLDRRHSAGRPPATRHRPL